MYVGRARELRNFTWIDDGGAGFTGPAAAAAAGRRRRGRRRRTGVGGVPGGTGGGTGVEGGGVDGSPGGGTGGGMGMLVVGQHARRQIEEQELERLRLRRHLVGLAAARERLARIRVVAAGGDAADADGLLDVDVGEHDLPALHVFRRADRRVEAEVLGRARRRVGTSTRWWAALTVFTECSEPLTASCPSVGLAFTAAVFSHCASAIPLGNVWLTVKVDVVRAGPWC